VKLILIPRARFDAITLPGASIVWNSADWLILRITNGRLLKWALAQPGVKRVPPLATAAARLPAGIRQAVGNLAPDAVTVLDVLRDITGNEELGE